MKSRTSAPGSTNKYYIRKTNGGYNPCIGGNTAHGLRPFLGSVLPNCTGYVTGRTAEIIGEKTCKFFGNTNAENFYKLGRQQGLETGFQPRPGAVAVWSKGKAGVDSDGAGHVAVVEKTNWSTWIQTSESGWGFTSCTVKSCRRINANGNWDQPSGYYFLGFVYNPAVCPYRDPSGTVKKGSKGNDARFVQWCLWKDGCFKSGKKSEIDGSFGKRSVDALKIFQKKHSLAQDGHAGPATQAVMKTLYTIQ